MGRYVRRPLWWVPVALFLGVLIYGSELQDVWDDERTFGRGEPLVGAVDESYDGGRRVPVLYRHPHFGQVRTSIGLSRGDDPGQLAPGDPIALRAARENPFTVRLPRDDPGRPSPALPLLFPSPFLVASARRWWVTGRARQLVERRPSASFEGPGADPLDAGRTGDGSDEAVLPPMRGRLRSRGHWRRQTVVLDLFPWDADPRRTAVCSVPLVSSLGLPLDSPATFPVAVHGRPQRLGRTVAEVPDGLLWPRRRALLLPQWFRGVWRAGEADPEPEPRLQPRTLRAPKQTWPAPRSRVRAAAVVLVVAVVVGGLGTVSTLRAAEESDDLPPGSIEVPAEVVGAEDGLLRVAFTLPDDEGAQADAADPDGGAAGATGTDGEADSDSAAQDQGEGGTGTTAETEGAGQDQGEGGTGTTAEAGAAGQGDAEGDEADGSVGGDQAGPEGNGERVTSLVATPDRTLWAEGTPLLVVVDPDYLTRVHLPPRPYRKAEPLVWGWAPALVAGLWLLRTLRWQGWAERAVLADPWYRVDVDPVGRTTFLVSRPGAPSPSCLVALPPSYDQPPPAIARTLARGAQVYAQPLPAPGAQVALRFGGTVVASSAAALTRDRPWRRRLRGLVAWLQLPARLRPT